MWSVVQLVAVIMLFYEGWTMRYILLSPPADPLHDATAMRNRVLLLLRYELCTVHGTIKQNSRCEQPLAQQPSKQRLHF